MGEYEKRDLENFRKEPNRASRNKNVITKIKRKISMDRLNSKLNTTGELMNYDRSKEITNEIKKKSKNMKKMVKKSGDIMEMSNLHLKECLKECKMSKRQNSEITADNLTELKTEIL